MYRKLTLSFVVLAVSLAIGVTVAIAGTVRSIDDPGVTSKTILLGGTGPLTGVAGASAAALKGADAYFRYVNGRGGVNGRTIVYRVLDDASDPVVTTQLTKQLVEQDKVFALFNAVGTENNIAVRPYLNSLKVPQLFVDSGATTFGRDYAQYPYTIGFQPSYQAEGWVYGDYLAHTAPGTQIAVLFANDDFGKDLLSGLKLGLERSSAKVIAAQPYAADTTTDVSAQLAKLKASGADTLAIFASPAFAIQAYGIARKLGWRPKHVVGSSAAASPATMAAASEGGKNKLVNGTISIVFLKDPNDPQWSHDPGMNLYRKILSRYAPTANPKDPLFVYGMAAAWTAVEAIRRVGPKLSRDALQKELDTFTATGNPFLLPGIAVKTAGSDHFPLAQMLLQRWQNGAWKSFGGLWEYPAT